MTYGPFATVILVTGAMCARGTHAPFAELLSQNFTVINYDRRGRGRWVRLLDGGASDAWMRETAQRVAKTLPNAEYGTLEGQTHQVSEDVLVPALVKFFS